MQHKSSAVIKYAALGLVGAVVAAVVLAAPEQKTITPGTIEYARRPLPNGGMAIDENKIVGSFVVSPSTGDDSILSGGTGGACLTADLNRRGYPKDVHTCAKNSDCQVGLPKGWSGYCGPDGREGQVEKKICWVRPGPDHTELCNKSPMYTPPKIWDSNKIYSSNNEPFDLKKPRYLGHAGQELVNFSFNQEFPGPVRWRVVACLNGVFTPGPDVNPPCGGGDETNRREKFGDIKWIPHAPLTPPVQDHPPFPPENPRP
jgi:hypothetical protein